ncbi:hypothetical protein TNCV_1125311 [Trichonephila clavipes]|nr:hypothetical protein TNCV_1125311 [Trichonephila clavipes]
MPGENLWTPPPRAVEPLKQNEAFYDSLQTHLNIQHKLLQKYLRHIRAQRYQANGSHCEAMAVLTCPKPIPQANLVPRPNHNKAFVGFTQLNNQGIRNIQGNAVVEEWNKTSQMKPPSMFNPCQIC